MVRSANKKRIGILGGSFNPIHHGHLLMAELARQKMRLDQVIFMPANLSPFKSKVPAVSPHHRLAMIKLAIQDNHYFSVSELELKRKGISYTIDTLKGLRVLNPNAQLFWIIGDDHVSTLSSWKKFDEIVTIASFIAVSRLWFNVSSSEIRALARQKKSLRYLTTDHVIRYIDKHRLYQH